MTENEYRQYILAHFHCEEGVITRDDRKGSNGSIDQYGYLILKIKGKQFKAHRIIWLLHNGEFPTGEIDHINRDKTDNRIENLRISNRVEQNRNKSFYANPKTGVAGIYIDNTTNGLKKKYTFRCLGKTYRYYTLEEAIREKENVRKITQDSMQFKSTERAI